MGGSCYLRRVWLVVALFTSLLSLAWGDESARRYGCEQPIRLAWLENLIVYRDGKGFDPDLIGELQRRSGCQIEAVNMSRAEAWQAMADGRIDLLTNVIPSAERMRTGYFIPTLYYRNKVIIRADLGRQIESFDALMNSHSLLFGAVRGLQAGGYYDAGLRLLRQQGRVRDYRGEGERFAALLNGDVGAVVAHEISLERRIPQSRYLDFLVLDLSPAPSTQVGLLLSRSRFSAAAAGEWLRMLEAMRLDGTLSALVLAHMPAHLTDEFLKSGHSYDLSQRSNRQ